MILFRVVSTGKACTAWALVEMHIMPVPSVAAVLSTTTTLPSLLQPCGAAKYETIS